MAPNGSLLAGPGDPPPLLKRLHRLYRKARKRVLGPIQKPAPVSAKVAPTVAPIAKRPATSSTPPSFAPVLTRSAATGAVQPPAPPGSIDAFALRALRLARADGAGGEDGGDGVFFPSFERTTRIPSPPPPGICFMVPADARSLAGVEMLLLSLLDIYPELASPILIAMETAPDPCHRRRFARISPLIDFVTPPAGWDALYPELAGEPARQRLTLHALAIADHDRVVVIQPDALVLGDISEAWTGAGLILGYDVSDAGFVALSARTGDHVFDTALISIPAAMRGTAAVAAMADCLPVDEVVDPHLDRYPVRRRWNLFARDREKTVLPLRCSLSAMYVLKCLEGSRQGVCLLHDNGEDPWLPSGGK